MTTDKAISRAARAMAMRSVKARKAAWGEEEFKRRMQQYGILGGRPKGTGKRQTKKGGR